MVFESPEVADKVVSSKHTIDRREVEAKRAVPKDETQASQAAADASQKTRKIFVGGLAPTVDDQVGVWPAKQWTVPPSTFQDARWWWWAPLAGPVLAVSWHQQQD